MVKAPQIVAPSEVPVSPTNGPVPQPSPSPAIPSSIVAPPSPSPPPPPPSPVVVVTSTNNNPPTTTDGGNNNNNNNGGGNGGGNGNGGGVVTWAPPVPSQAPPPAATTGPDYVPASLTNLFPSKTSTAKPASNDGSASNATNVIIIASVVAGCVVLAGVGILIFRKWKLKPSGDFKKRFETAF
jgi:hypothetical protein